MERRLFDKYQRKNPPRPFEFGALNVPKSIAAAVVPIYNEPLDELSQTLDNLLENLPDALILAVINRPKNAPEHAHKANLESLKYLRHRLDSTPRLGVMDLQIIQGGVGEARKGGLDSAIPLISHAENTDKAILLSMDADTRIGPGYWPMVQKSLSEFKGAAFNVRHRAGSTVEQENAIREYERYLEHFQQGLEYAGSPFAFKALGSAIACTVAGYIEAGGMRVREAGEDFYFLQAMAKCFPVKFCKEVQVFPSPRCSERVPFGTGRAVARLMRGDEQEFFPKHSFEDLKKVIEQAKNGNLISAEKFLSSLNSDSEAFFRHLGFVEKWTKTVGVIPEGSRINEFFKLFDGLKQLQFLKWIAAGRSGE